MNLTADQIPALLDDFGAANAEMKALALQAPAHWNRGLPGKWTIGQHVEHVGRMEALSAERLEESAAKLRAGTLEPRPRRGILQSLFIGLVTGKRFPRGGKTVSGGAPAATVDRDAAFAKLDEGLARHRKVADSLTPEQQDQIWFWNPYAKFRWHYRLAEILRVHANHTRHHTRQCAEYLLAAGVARVAA